MKALILLLLVAVTGHAHEYPKEVLSWQETNVVRIIAGNNKHTGTGFYIDAEHIMTAAHVVTDFFEKNVHVFGLYDPVPMAIGKVVYVNDKDDIAIIKASVNDQITPALFLLDGSTRGDLVYSVGFSSALWIPVLSHGTFNGFAPFHNVNSYSMQTSPGDSGSPILQMVDGTPVITGMRNVIEWYDKTRDIPHFNLTVGVPVSKILYSINQLQDQSNARSSDNPATQQQSSAGGGNKKSASPVSGTCCRELRPQYSVEF